MLFLFLVYVSHYIALAVMLGCRLEDACCIVMYSDRVRSPAVLDALCVYGVVAAAVQNYMSVRVACR